MADKVLGLDIGNTSVKVVQVTGGLRGYHVTGCHMVEIGPDGGLEQAMESALKPLQVNGYTCVSSFQADRLSFRNLVLPFKDPKKIEQTLGYELEPLLPVSVETVTTDYIASDQGDNTPILAGAVADEIVEKHLAFLANYNIDPDVVDMGGTATALQLAKHQDGASNVLLLDVGARVSSATLILDGNVALVRSFHFGGATLTDAAAASKGVSFEQAERMKRSEQGRSLSEILKPQILSFCRDINNTLHAFRSQMTDRPGPDRVLLTGGGALFPDVGTLLQDSLKLPLQALDLKAHMNLEFEEEASDHWNPYTMNNALALALRDAKAKNSFNFRRGKFKKKKRYDQFRGEVKRFAVYVSVVLLVLAAGFGADYYVLKKEQGHLEQQIMSVFKKAFPDSTRIVDPVQQMKVKIREAKESLFLPTDTVLQGAVVDVLRDITVRIPNAADLDVSSLVIDDEKVRLKGSTDDFNTVDGIKIGLQDSEYLKDVAIASAQLDNRTNKVRFELVMGRK
jgi:general secretion pathway protein L